MSFVECSRGVIEHAARCIANVAVNGSLALTFFELKDTTAEPRIVLCTENLSEAIMSEGGLEILDMARGLGPASPQLCRAIANLAKSGMPTTIGPCVVCVECGADLCRAELCKDRLVSLGWLRQIRNWLLSPDPYMQITGLAALANLASPGSFPSREPYGPRTVLAHHCWVSRRH